MTDPIVCDDCGEAVTLDRDEYNTLTVTCACDGYRTVKVNQRLPEGWSA